jgi:hypothetical protein
MVHKIWTQLCALITFCAVVLLGEMFTIFVHALAASLPTVYDCRCEE